MSAMPGPASRVGEGGRYFQREGRGAFEADGDSTIK